MTTRSSFSRFRLLLVLLGATALLQTGCGDSNASAPSGEMKAFEHPPVTRLRVRADPIQMDRLPAGGRVTGTVRAFHRAVLTAETQGRVLARAVEPGAAIEAGGLILELEGSRFELELRRAEASLRAARTVLKHARRELERGERLIAQNAISTQKHDDLGHNVDRAKDELALSEVARDTARRNLEDTKIRAPFAGTVDSVAVDVGDFVAPGTPVATLVDLSKVRIFGGVTAQEAARLKAGTIARVSFSDLGGELFEARLESVGRVAGEMDGTYGIELRMEDEEGVMRDGMVAQIEFPDQQDEPRLLARRAALLRRDGHPEVFIVEGRDVDTVARARRVRTGRTEGDWVEVLGGLEAGERVIWDGHFALADGTAVIVDGDETAASTSSSPSAPATNP